MEYRFIARTVVYEYAGALVPVPTGSDEWRIAHAREIDSVFCADPQRRDRFQRYVDARYAGIVLVRGGRWISYGWCTNPQSQAPPHLPRWVGSLGAYWIFGCHTHAAFRHQGIYKELLARLVALVRESYTSAKIYIDTHVDNMPSRRGILASGFKPCGVFSTYRVWAPLVGTQVVGGRWRNDEPHPTSPRDLPVVPTEILTNESPYTSSSGMPASKSTA